MKGSARRVAKTIAIAAVISLHSAYPVRAGGESFIRSPASRDVVDLSSEVRAQCSRVKERRLPDGVRVQVLYPPELEDLAGPALEMLEKVHDALAQPLGLSIKEGSRLFLVQRSTYPPSFRAVDNAAGTPEWVFLRPGAPDAEASLRIQEAVYGTLPHEWAHAIFDDRFGVDSPLGRARWIVEGFASYAMQVASPRLSSEMFDRARCRQLPYFNLDATSLSEMVRWKYPRKLPPSDLEDEQFHYGAAAGLLLRVGESGGPKAVLAFLDILKDARKIRKEEIEAALVTVTGRRYEDLARMSPEEKEAAFREALADLDGPGFWRRLLGLKVLSRLPDRAGLYTEKVERLAAGPGIEESVRAEARSLLTRGGRSER